MFGRIDWNPDRQKLRSFAVSLAVASLLAALVLLLFSRRSAAIIVTLVGGLLALGGWVIPSFGKPVYWIWMGISFVLGWITSPVFTVLIFYIITTPIGWIRRLVRRDPLDLRPDEARESYFEDHPPGGDPESFKRQF